MLKFLSSAAEITLRCACYKLQMKNISITLVHFIDSKEVQHPEGNLGLRCYTPITADQLKRTTLTGQTQQYNTGEHPKRGPSRQAYLYTRQR